MPTPQKVTDPPGDHASGSKACGACTSPTSAGMNVESLVAAAHEVPRAAGPVPGRQEHAAEARVPRARHHRSSTRSSRGRPAWCSAPDSEVEPGEGPDRLRQGATRSRASRRRSWTDGCTTRRRSRMLATLPQPRGAAVAGAGHPHRPDDAVPGRDRRARCVCRRSWRTCSSGRRARLPDERCAGRPDRLRGVRDPRRVP